MKINAQPTPISSRRLTRARQRAASTGTPLLATALQKYCDLEKMSWPQLAARLGCDKNALDAVALCRPPREEYFVSDAKAIAEGYLDWQKLVPLLRELQVISAFAAPDVSDAILLAARDYDEGETPTKDEETAEETPSENGDKNE